MSPDYRGSGSDRGTNSDQSGHRGGSEIYFASPTLHDSSSLRNPDSTGVLTPGTLTPEAMEAAHAGYDMGDQLGHYDNYQPHGLPNNGENLRHLYSNDGNGSPAQVTNPDDGEDYDEHGEVNTPVASDYNPYLPWTREVQLDERERIKEAMKNTDDVVDADQHDGSDAQAVQSIKNNYYPEVAYDGAARNVLEHTFVAQDRRLVQRYLGVDHDHFESVSDRLESIKDSLRKSKAMVKQLLDPYFLYRLCDAPKKELARKIQNRTLNAKRNMEVRKGKEAMAQEKKQAVEDGAETEAVATPKNQTSAEKKPSTRKRASTTKTTSTRKRPTTKTLSKQSTAASKLTSSKRTRGIDDAEAYETPPKRGKPVATASASLQVAQSVVAPSGGFILAAGPSALRTHGPVVMNGPHTQYPDEVVRLQWSGLGITELEQLAENVPLLPGVREELSVRYRRFICNLLSVHPDHAENTTLIEMRVYGRAYNGSLYSRKWFCLAMHGRYEFGIGHLLYEANGTITHFAEAMQRPFIGIANERGDVLSGRLPNPNGHGYFSQPTPIEQRALGMIDNPLGKPNGLSSNPLDPRDMNPTQSSLTGLSG